MDSADHVEPNNDACCEAGIEAGSDDPLIHACEKTQTYDVIPSNDGQ